jgi:hypothetical protein
LTFYPTTFTSIDRVCQDSWTFLFFFKKKSIGIYLDPRSSFLSILIHAFFAL